ncbi:M18 family aminopeptidase [Fibrobacter sp. UWB5]|uniref:M18 family aminopeptidase n=1 Tax=Fibrobacter sp. UWB5 TaxID=1964360 RepID=UPI000B520EBC|nr:M18 family aminopeptidase [Fibrobacter sp. UWB5]OWV14003.1 M18 family aminopeptidase [Fibrobacter sp. UWB5]
MEYFEFLNKSVTPYHTVEALKVLFDAKCEKNTRFFERGGALIAVRTPKQICSDSQFRIALAHTDFPTLKITPNPDGAAAGVRTLHPEIYGSPLFTSWLDRDLGYAGLLAYELGGKLQTKLIRGDKLFRIPQLAVHLNRGVNQDGLKVNPQTDLNALWTAVGGKERFVEALQAELPAGAKLLDFDVQLFDAQPAQFGGFENEWIYSGRLDNLSSCHAIAEAFAAAGELEKDFQVAAFFNNEEVGSTTREGAGSNFLRSVLESSLSGSGTGDLDSMLAASLALSIDMAHAEHPNFVQKHESNHAPVLGGGVVLKMNSQKRYASDVFSNARFKLLCEQNNIPYQTFVMRNDMPCGSTVGPTISASLGIPTVDIGEPMLSMHSIREMTDVADHESMIRLVTAFFG